MKVLRFGVALLAAGRLLANYQFYYTDNLTSINPATWTQNGNPLPQGYGATLISTVASPTGSDYDIRMTVPQAGCAAYATLYARSTPDASTSYSVEFASSGITLSKTLAGSSTTLSYLPPYCAAGMVVRMVMQGNNIIVYYGPYSTSYQDPNPITTGQPGVFLRSAGSITNVELGPIDYVPPPPISASSVLSPAAPGWVDLSWPAGSDDPNGTGLAGYNVYRNGVYLGSPATPTWLDETVTAGTGVTYSLYAYSQQGMVSTAATVNVTVPPTSQPDQRRIGVRPTGAYWGAAGEQIDLLSGNVNFSLPLLTAMGRGNWSVTFSLSNNSQIWRQDASGVRLLGEDLGVGLGWKLQAGSIRPVWFGGAIQHVVYSDSTGAEYILDQNNNGVWTSLTGGSRILRFQR